MRTSPQPSVIIPHLTTSVALLLSALMRRRFGSCQCKLHAHPRLSAHVTQRINVTNHLQGTAPPPTTATLRCSLLISQSMFFCSSLRVFLSLLIIYSFLFLSSRQTCEQRLKASRRGQARAGESWPWATWPGLLIFTPAKKKKKGMKKRNYH